jgi:hypothetical protein
MFILLELNDETIPDPRCYPLLPKSGTKIDLEKKETLSCLIEWGIHG